MKKENRLKKNEDFQLVFQQGSSVANRQFVVYSLYKKDQQYLRIGFSVSKKIGNAVMRNKIKRYLREALEGYIKEINPSQDLIIIARKPVLDMDLGEITKSLRHVLNKGKLFSNIKSRQK